MGVELNSLRIFLRFFLLGLLTASGLGCSWVSYITFTQATGFNNFAVRALVSDGTSLFVGGDFTTYRGSNAQRVAKIDLVSGTLDTTFTDVVQFGEWH